MIIFETSRLQVRSLSHTDIVDLLSIYQQKKNMRYIQSGRTDWTNTELKTKVERCNQGENGGLYGIFLIENQQLIGEVGLFDSFQDATHLEMGYILDHLHWQKGLGYELVKALMNHAFSKLKVKQLSARMYAENQGSIKLAEKLGMEEYQKGTTPEGREFRWFVATN
ncbi:GNAT family N-acetyltransferase [Persicobacter sp. CCB-QB2]|uniref:GNAT family N-acetyltransferase n=1 Tax=Persicobacter sp. CCB-QB2 TaxID=1561025 RepID=UPI0006A9AA9F|nr:GNAT family N-acetyltransferase [Persicobacter sp. CCB-QB2]